MPTKREIAAETGRRPKSQDSQEIIYTHDEIEFMMAIDKYKIESGRQFPTCSEILSILRKLGYSKSY